MTAKYKTNILRGPGTAHLRDVEFLSAASDWEATLERVPNNQQAFPTKTFKQASTLLRRAPQTTSFRVTYREESRFNPARTTTGYIPFDVKLAAVQAPVKYLTFQMLPGANVKLIEGGEAIKITTVKVIVQGPSDSVLTDMDLPNVVLWRDGQIELEEPSSGDDSP